MVNDFMIGSLPPLFEFDVYPLLRDYLDLPVSWSVFMAVPSSSPLKGVCSVA